jgi:hypothetical protein
MKHDAIVEQGIPILERIPIPEEMIPADSRVEIDAKIQAGYCKSPNGLLLCCTVEECALVIFDCGLELT